MPIYPFGCWYKADMAICIYRASPKTSMVRWNYLWSRRMLPIIYMKFTTFSSCPYVKYPEDFRVLFRFMTFQTFFCYRKVHLGEDDFNSIVTLNILLKSIDTTIDNTHSIKHFLKGQRHSLYALQIWVFHHLCWVETLKVFCRLQHILN